MYTKYVYIAPQCDMRSVHSRTQRVRCAAVAAALWAATRSGSIAHSQVSAASVYKRGGHTTHYTTRLDCRPWAVAHNVLQQRRCRSEARTHISSRVRYYPIAVVQLAAACLGSPVDNLYRLCSVLSEKVTKLCTLTTRGSAAQCTHGAQAAGTALSHTPPPTLVQLRHAHMPPPAASAPLPEDVFAAMGCMPSAPLPSPPAALPPLPVACAAAAAFVSASAPAAAAVAADAAAAAAAPGMGEE
jgi:hypothetical protein